MNRQRTLIQMAEKKRYIDVLHVYKKNFIVYQRNIAMGN